MKDTELFSKRNIAKLAMFAFEQELKVKTKGGDFQQIAEELDSVLDHIELRTFTMHDYLCEKVVLIFKIKHLTNVYESNINVTLYKGSHAEVIIKAIRKRCEKLLSEIFGPPEKKK